MSTNPAPAPSPGKVLFSDVRHICCGDLRWLSPSGEGIPVTAEGTESSTARAELTLQPRGVRFKAEPGRKMDLDTPTPPGSPVFYDSGLYRTWGLIAEFPPGKNFGAYAQALPTSVAIAYWESTDGYEWTEKARTPIDALDQSGFDGMTFFIDENAPPVERYKFIYCAIAPESERQQLMAELLQRPAHERDWRQLGVPDGPRVVYALTSSDGLHWEGRPRRLMTHISDTDTTVTYSQEFGRYLMYTRYYNFERREIALAESEDFWRWTPVHPFIWQDLSEGLSTDIYTNGYSRYPGQPEYHFMFPMVYDRFDQRSSVYLYSSPDGLRWYRVPGGPIIEPGESGEWDSEYIHISKHLVPLDDKIAMPYHGTCYPHKYPRWPDVLSAWRKTWVYWPQGRLCALQAEREGEFHAFGRWAPTLPAGRALRLNVRTHRAGEVRVGIRGVKNRSVDDCDPICGNLLSAPVHWRGEEDIGVPDDQPITLHFKLHSAEVFGLEWQ